MREITVPAAGGRSVLIRPGHDGETVQLAIVSVHGNIIEAVSLDQTQVPSVEGGLAAMQEVASRDLMAALSRRETDADRRYREALERNPWLRETREAREKRGLK